jgi:hypothetical protein
VDEGVVVSPELDPHVDEAVALGAARSQSPPTGVSVPFRRSPSSVPPVTPTQIRRPKGPARSPGSTGRLGIRIRIRVPFTIPEAPTASIGNESSETEVASLRRGSQPPRGASVHDREKG